MHRRHDPAGILNKDLESQLAVPSKIIRLGAFFRVESPKT